MNTDAITAKIMEEAREQAAALLKEADEKAEQMRIQAEEELAHKRGQADESLRVQVRDMRDRMLRMAELDQKKAMLAVKRQVIDEAFENALERMRKMDAADKKAYLCRLLVDSAAGGEELIVSEEEKDLYDDAFMDRINACLAQAGKKPVRPGGARKLGGGFALREGGMEINCTYASVIGQARPGLESEVAAMLFQET